MVSTYSKHTEQAEPFHTQNALHSLRLSSLPFAGRLYINPEACPKPERRSLIAQQRVWLNTKHRHKTLVIVTDGSKTDRAAGWAITGIHAGKILFKHNIPLAKRAGNHDAEMMALSHMSKLVLKTMLGTPDIREFRIFSDSTAALTSIFDLSPHAAQQASFLFRDNMLKLFSQRKDITGKLVWTPGHGRLDYMTIMDKNAKAAANRKLSNNQYLLPLFVSRSAALTEVKTMALKEWHTFLDNLVSRTQNIVTKINILLQEICDMKIQNQRKHIFNVHKNRPKDTGEGNGQDDTHLIYNNASTHPLPDIPNTPRHHAPNPNHTPNIDDSAFALQKPDPYALWSVSPLESPSSSSSNEDSTDDNAGRDKYGLMKTTLPLKRVGMGEGEQETRGGMEEGLPDPFSDAVTKMLGPESDPEPECR